MHRFSIFFFFSFYEEDYYPMEGIFREIKIFLSIFVNRYIFYLITKNIVKTLLHLTTTEMVSLLQRPKGRVG